MTTDKVLEEGDMSPQTVSNDITDIESYRKLVQNFLNIRRYKSALYWSEKVAVLSKNSPNDVYQLAKCMYMLKEYNRASYIIKKSGLFEKNLQFLTLLVECLYASNDHQEALNLLTSTDFEDLCTSLHDEAAPDATLNDNDKSNMLASLYLLKAKILESMDKRTLAIDCYIQALQKSVYLTEALDALLQHDVLLSWEEKDLLHSILPNKQNCNEADLKILKYLYEQKLKKYYSTATQSINSEKTPNNAQIINTINEKIKIGESITDTVKSIGLSTSTTIKSSANAKQFLTPGGPANIISPANKILYELKNTSASSYSIQASLSRAALQNVSRTLNTTYISANMIKNSEDSLTGDKALKMLEQSVDILVSKAEEYFYNCDYNKCMKIIDEILERDPYHKRTLFVQIGCLMDLKDSNALFYMAHKLVDFNPDDAISWYAVGSYYILINKTEQGRRYLSKAASLDRLFGPAWLLYGHSFAKEKEHDSAMSAYFKATQLMRGCHLPLLYLGVMLGIAKNYDVAEKFFYQAMSLAPLDVFVLHELGVVKYEMELYEDAEEIFRSTLNMVTEMCKRNKESLSERWEPLLNNLGHCCRKNKKLTESLSFHMQALSLKPTNAQTYTSIGFVHALMGRLSEAVEAFHKSLALKRDDVITSTILKTVLEDLVEEIVEPDEIVKDTKSDMMPVDLTTDPSTEELKNANVEANRFDRCKLKFDENDDVAEMSLD